MELVALAALGSISAYLGISDWNKRIVDLHGILVCYGIAACINLMVILTNSHIILVLSDYDISWKAPTAPAWQLNMGKSAGATTTSIIDIDHIAGSILTVIFLSGMLFAFYRIGLLASGDTLGIPAILAVLILVAEPIKIIVYFVSAMVFVLAISVARNLRNNVRCREALYGPLRRRLYLLLFCYYGDGAACKYSFSYTGGTRRNYDRESYYIGKEKTWLVPGIPLLSGFMPAILVLLLI
jgi:hypothetical protein